MDSSKYLQSIDRRWHHRRLVVHGCLAPLGNQDPAGRQPAYDHRELPRGLERILPLPGTGARHRAFGGCGKTTRHTGGEIFREHGHFTHEQHV